MSAIIKSTVNDLFKLPGVTLMHIYFRGKLLQEVSSVKLKHHSFDSLT